jgi:hypothetical protein
VVEIHPHHSSQLSASSFCSILAASLTSPITDERWTTLATKPPTHEAHYPPLRYFIRA